MEVKVWEAAAEVQVAGAMVVVAAVVVAVESD